ncbi:MAG: hypothetical protein OEZ18_00765 [Candidatus Bathyarchaeota archaeon]|nr:hypothetical protein [Candidatus Bathyarchaeota archaeon]
MKKSNLKKMRISKSPLYNRLVTSFKRALRIGDENDETALDLQFSSKEFYDKLLTHEELKIINAQLLEMEVQKAKAMQQARERNSLI